MKHDMLDSCAASIPPRSYLYSLPVQGLDTSFGESLTSYIARLAQAYHVFPGVLMERELSPIIDRAYGGGNLHTIYQHVAALNGTGVMALNMVHALQTLTLQDKLHHLTMIPWANVFVTRKLLRSVRAWCPVCYEEWQLNSKVVYEPLIWAIDAVRICSLHQYLLVTECPYCHLLNKPLDWKSQPGHCSECQKWLGLPQGVECSSISSTELNKLLWIANNIKNLLAVTPFLKTPCDRRRISQALKAYVNQVTEGNVAELARKLAIPKNTFWLWYHGNNLPTLESLLKICYCLNTSLSDFLLGELQNLDREELVLPPSMEVKQRAIAKVFDETFLLTLQDQLQKFLDSDAVPPLSMEQIAEQLECDRRTIYRHFPEICQKISAKFDSYQKSQFVEAIEQACAEVRRVVSELYSESIYPSEARVSERMKKPGYLRYKNVRSVLHEARDAVTVFRQPSH